MAGFQCPYCSMIMPIPSGALTTQTLGFNSSNVIARFPNGEPVDKSSLEIEFYNCPNCGEYSIKAKGVGAAVKDVDVPIRPTSSAKKFPNYIPLGIR